MGVVDYGIPVMPTDDIYYKSTLHIYSMAALMKAFGVSEMSTRILSSIYGALTIGLIYYAVKRFLNENRMLAFTAAVIFTFSLWAVAWAREARFYQQFQFFTLLTVYLFYLAYIEPLTKSGNDDPGSIMWNNRYIILSITAFILAVLSSKLAIILLAPLGLTLIYLKGIKHIFKVPILLSILIMAGFWIIVQLLPVIFSFETKNPVMEADKVGLGLDMLISNVLSYGWFMLMNIAMFTLIIAGSTLKHFRKNTANLFLLFNILVISVIMIAGFATPHLLLRYFYFVLPLLIITATRSSYEIARVLGKISQVKKGLDNSNRVIKGKKNEIRIFVLLIIMILVIDAKFFLIPGAVYDPYSSSDMGMWQVSVHPDYRDACEYLRENYIDGDVVLVKRERTADFYLNTYLDNKNVNVDNYVVLSYVDLNLSATQELFDEHRVWVLMDHKEEQLVPDFISKDVYDLLKENTESVFKSGDRLTMVWLERG